MLVRILTCLFLMFPAAAHAENAVDLSPVKCSWAQLSPDQQERLRNAFSVDSAGSGRVLRFVAPGSQETRTAAAACNLPYNASQLTELGYALGAKAAEEVGRMGVANRELLKPDIIDRALEKMHEGKRQIIGDFMACPGMGAIYDEWDQSLISAMRRTRIRIVDGRTVALIAIAMYSIMSEEGYMRRINGTAPPCEPGG